MPTHPSTLGLRTTARASAQTAWRARSTGPPRARGAAPRHVPICTPLTGTRSPEGQELNPGLGKEAGGSGHWVKTCVK